jgi:hypothetical protein
MSTTPQPSSPSAALMTTTTMTPQQLYQGGDLNAQYDTSNYNNVQLYLEQYGQLRDQYIQTINAALHEQDQGKRSEMMPQISSLNEQLVSLVNKIQSIYNQGQSVLSVQSPESMQDAINQYKQQLEELRTDEDELVKLTRLYKDVQSQSVVPQTTYFMLILGIVILLFIVFALFVGSLFTQSQTSVLPTAPTPPTITIPTVESINSAIQKSFDSLKTSLGLQPATAAATV